jgi:hypothetical protein
VGVRRVDLGAAASVELRDGTVVRTLRLAALAGGGPSIPEILNGRPFDVENVKRQAREGWERGRTLARRVAVAARWLVERFCRAVAAAFRRVVVRAPRRRFAGRRARARSPARPSEDPEPSSSGLDREAAA